MARRLRRGGPTDAELDAIDDRLTEPAEGDDRFDEHSVEHVLQAETGYPDQAIPVEIVSPVRVDELPTRSGGMFTRSITTTPNRSLLTANPLRKLATIVPLDGDIRVGTTQNEAMAAGAGAVWPAAVPLVLSLADDIWVAAVTGTVNVSVLVEHWSR